MGLVVIFSVTQITKSSCPRVEGGRGEELEARKTEEEEEELLHTLIARSLKALRQGEIQSLVSLDSTRIIKRGEKPL